MVKPNSRPPADFLCPITNELMDDPVIDPIYGGVSFERRAIMKWLIDDGNTECPITGAPMNEKNLVANSKLQWKIRFWKKQQCDNSQASVDSNSVQAQQDAQSSDQSQHDDSSKSPPKRFLCPLTNKIMQDPMLSKHGHNYERLSILQWIAMRGGICPLSYKPLDLSQLTPNIALQRDIQMWEEEQARKAKKNDSSKRPSNDFMKKYKYDSKTGSMLVKQAMSSFRIPKTVTLTEPANHMVSLDNILDDVEDALLEAENITLNL